MDVDGNIYVILPLRSCPQPLHTMDEQKPSTAYSSMSPACSLPARFDSPTVHNCITHHHTSLFNTSLSPFSPSHCKAWLEISSADGGRDCLLVISAGLCTCFFLLCYSRVVLKCRKVCARGDVSCAVCGWVWAFMCVCRSVWETKVCVSVWEEGNVSPVRCWT